LRTDDTRQARQPAGEGRQAALRLRQREAGGVGRKHNVAGQRELKATAKGNALRGHIT